ncbi:MAG: CRISPR-associated ring nuclease Crn3/Csx3 [Planctomycetales bacterium]|nr:CRISPR-associated ring nuclease Crn3/Csx3 [Planctomycetales bacterium]
MTEPTSAFTSPPAAAQPVIFYSIGVDHPITPDEPMPSLPPIPRGALVVIEGRAPIWRYGVAFHKLHGSPAGAVAVFDPRLGAVVVASHSPQFSDGRIIDVTPPFPP